MSANDWKLVFASDGVRCNVACIEKRTGQLKAQFYDPNKEKVIKMAKKSQ